MNKDLTKGDLVMFRKPNHRWLEPGDPYLYGFIIKKIPPYTSWNKSKKLKYDIFTSSGRLFYEIKDENVIFLARSVKKA